MIDYSKTYSFIESSPASKWLDSLKQEVDSAFASKRWGDLSRWRAAVDSLPNLKPAVINLNADRILVGRAEARNSQELKALEGGLRELIPWRKGPFSLFGIEIDTEWRSDMKWNRLKKDIASLDERCVLDVGCGSGYHCWRAKGAGSKLVVGVDPTLVYVMQFYALQKYVNDPSVCVFPVGIENIPLDLECFDTVFSMGLLYHRRSPLDHLLQLNSFLREGGELVLETLVIDGKEGEVLNPQGRYAKMPNVWFIPSVGTLENWLKRMGFENINVVDV
ncbi:tRNA (mo5U34)-methyltransferase, partial [hydrothermal vent metagenome]